MTETLANGHSPALLQPTAAKAAHVNMMTDTIIANMPPDGLRAIMRGLLGGDTSLTKKLHMLASKYLESQPVENHILFLVTSTASTPTPAFFQTQGRYRCLMGCGYGFESMKIVTDVLRQAENLEWDAKTEQGEELLDVLATIDGDLVQAVTAIQKQLLTDSGLRKMDESEVKIVAGLKSALEACRDRAFAKGQEFAFERGFSSLARIAETPTPYDSSTAPRSNKFESENSALETFTLGSANVPRMFMGLWQFSSPAWGTASRSKINADFRKHVDAGFTAYDMADHYGDAEVTFHDSHKIYCATKWAVFEPITVSKEVVQANITKRLVNVDAKEIELLQFHWQDYADTQFIEAARLIAQDPRVRDFGLCNFDTKHMDQLLEQGIEIVSNQVQV
ncbi:hypothetical protein LOCC1_G003951 [Lachnellula occidentalis]|uniref:NADP-dependent oxidoreductase domain-containing protein n=1 Tax=Lachnellula occidentalis TaxID=215460 RepID=A0A8H8RX34_9HELO|nr:hypothetical protein LOCC1_G003951 [Lachnellula occidentalis]